jgi:predicted LPLAT superfamily acyltransferase
MTKSWHSLGEKSNTLALRLIRWIALNMGRPAARLLLYPITLYYLIFATEQRKASMLYLNRVLDRKPSLLDVAKHIHCFASTILDRVYLLTGQFEKLDVTFPKENMPLKYSRQGTGCILLGSHIGSFEVLRSYAVRKCPLPIKILMYEAHSPMILKILNALNPDVSNMVIPMGKPDSLLQVKDAVDAGNAVGMLGDRIMEMDSNKTARCTFLGGEIELPSAPILIAASLKVPVIVFFGIYLGGNRYQIHFELLSENITLDRNNRQQNIQKWLQKYADIMEKHIKQSPYNWFNFYDYWQEDQQSGN